MRKIMLFSDNIPTLTTVVGGIITPETIRNEHPAVDHVPFILEISGNTLAAIQELGAMRNFYDINESLSDDEAVAELERIINEPPTYEPPAEERIAAAMEFQNMVMLLNIEEGGEM